jgi:hypothetical protein
MFDSSGLRGVDWLWELTQGELTVSNLDETITWDRRELSDHSMTLLRMGRDQQHPLSGTDDLINWGYVCCLVMKLSQPIRWFIKFWLCWVLDARVEFFLRLSRLGGTAGLSRCSA